MGKWLKRILLVLVVLLLAGYFGIPMLIGTSWAREKVKAALEENTGREVDVGSISFGWFSGLKVHDVTVKQRPTDPQQDGPLFSLEALNLKVGLGEILDRTIRIDEFTVEAPRIVIIRDADGRFNFADLLGKPAEEPPGASKTKVVARMDIQDGTILYIDVPLGTRVEAKGIDATGTWDDGELALDLACSLNGGNVVLRANADLAKEPAPFEIAEFSIDGAQFDSNLAQLDLFLPLAGDSPQSASGKLGFRLTGMKGTGLTFEDLQRTLTADGTLSLEGGLLVSGPVTQLFGVLRGIGAGDLSALGSTAEARRLGVDLLTSTFRIADGKILTDDMKLDGAGIDLTLSGSTSLGGQIDYQIVAEGLGDLLAKNEEARKFLGDRKTLPIRFTGTLGAPEMSVDMEGAIRSRIEEEIKDRIPGGIKIPIPGGK